MITIDPGQAFAAEVTNFPASLAAGVVGVQLISVVHAVAVTPRITSVVEEPPGSGSYIAAIEAPTLPGPYTIFWDWCNGGTIIPSRTASEDLVVIGASSSGPSPVEPVPPVSGQPPVAVPHFAMPFRFQAGAALVYEQDTVEEIADCVANICRYTTGGRPEKPAFGVPPLLFVEGGPDPGLLAASVSIFEPRAKLAASADGSSLEELVSTIAIAVSDKGA